MRNQCPPGTICLNSISIILMIIIIAILIYMFSNKNKLNTLPDMNINVTTPTNEPSLAYSNPYGLPGPYYPPIKTLDIRPPPPMPINVATQGIPSSFSQIGILTGTKNSDSILPLMGRRILRNRDNWEYYTVSDQRNAIRLPISKNGKSCTSQIGCSELFNGDTVYVQGLNSPYMVTMYENDSIQYIPYI
jgi:hypothetical protein